VDKKKDNSPKKWNGEFLSECDCQCETARVAREQMTAEYFCSFLRNPEMNRWEIRCPSFCNRSMNRRNIEAMRKYAILRAASRLRFNICIDGIPGYFHMAIIGRVLFGRIREVIVCSRCT
jgi:hypothetical protein